MKKEKAKEFAKKYLIGFILGVISACTVSVIAATYFPSNQITYDNKESGLISTNVQDAIDELYGVCFPPKAGYETITDLVETNPDELYEDEHEDIRYYGRNPNNYVNFNNELWRIIGVIDGKIKIIRNESIGNMQWDTSGSNNWNNASLKSYLNNNYYNSIAETYKNMISEEIYYLGGPTTNNWETLTASGYYNSERSNDVYNGNPTSIKQYIGLMYPSDYGYATGEICKNIALQVYDEHGCQNSNYLWINQSEWLQSPIAGYEYAAVSLYRLGQVDGSYGGVGNSEAIRPSLYLASEVKITGGDGSQSNPYQLG